MIKTIAITTIAIVTLAYAVLSNSATEISNAVDTRVAQLEQIDNY